MYPLTLIAGHLLVDLPEGRVMIDTGCPYSFGEVPRLTVGARVKDIPSALSGFNMAHVRKLVHGPVVALLGMDLLDAQPVLFDVPAGVMRVGALALDDVHGSPRLRLSPRSGAWHPLEFDALVQGRRATVLFDTGAQVGYVYDAALLADATQAMGGLDTVLIAHGTLSDQERAQKDVPYALKEVEINGTSVVRISNDAAPLLAYFAGTGPAPALPSP